MRRIFRVALGVSVGILLLQLSGISQTGVTTSNFVNFEGAQTNPIRLAVSAVDGTTRLFAVNTPDARLSVFDVLPEAPDKPQLIAEIPVGIEPVSVNPRTTDEAWVVNQVSDSISIVSVKAGVVIDTIHVKDEPADVVFAGENASLAFVSVSRSNEVRVFDTATRAELARIPLEGSNPRALAVSPDGQHIYVAFALSGNKSTIIPANIAPPQDGTSTARTTEPPQVARIVDAEDPQWAPDVIKYTMPDNDVAQISVVARAVTRYFSGVGTINFGLSIDPSGNLLVTNTEARNLTRFENVLRGHIVDNRITRVDANGNRTFTDLNAGIDYALLPNDAANKQSLAQPTAIVTDAKGTSYVAAFGSDRVARVSPDGVVEARIDIGANAGLITNSRTMRGPRGLALSAAGRLYVLNRLSNTIAVVDVATNAVSNEIPVGEFDPTPSVIRQGRGFLYDARLSGNGTASCASCHIDADMDLLAWDLGNPEGEMQQVGGETLHPMKGPMTTQTLRGLSTMEPFHWRGDKANFVAFNPAFASLLGGSTLPDADMVAYRDYVNTLRFAPNPNRNLDGSLPASLAGGDPRAGRNTFLNESFVSNVTCNFCHTESRGGTNNQIFSASVINESQAMKVPHLRNMYQKTDFNPTAGARSVGGFGFIHDGTVGTLFEFLSNPLFQQMSTDEVRKRNVAAFLLAFDTGMPPAVGHTRTVTSANAGNADVANDWSVLEQQAAASRIDLIAKGTINGARGLLYRPTTNNYVSDKTGVGPFTRSQLVGFVTTAGETLTIMGVPAGSGTRMGIDRDVNGVLDSDIPGEAPPPPPPPAPAPAPTVMHVANIFATDAIGVVQTTFLRRDTVFWRVQVVDQNGAAVAGAAVRTQVRSNNNIVATLTATTGADGWARFSRASQNDPPDRAYTVSVAAVSKTDVVYDAAADLMKSITYILRK